MLHTHTHMHHLNLLTLGITSDKYKDSSLSHNRFCCPRLSLEVIKPFGVALAAACVLGSP